MLTIEHHTCIKLVGMEGLEPSRCCHPRILSPVCLPIPPHPHIYFVKTKFLQDTNSFNFSNSQNQRLKNFQFAVSVFNFLLHIYYIIIFLIFQIIALSQPTAHPFSLPHLLSEVAATLRIRTKIKRVRASYATLTPHRHMKRENRNFPFYFLLHIYYNKNFYFCQSRFIKGLSHRSLPSTRVNSSFFPQKVFPSIASILNITCPY